MFQISWKAAQPGHVPGFGYGCSSGTLCLDVWPVLKLDLFQAGVGPDDLLRSILT